MKIVRKVSSRSSHWLSSVLGQDCWLLSTVPLG